ncbi:hypothetical protein [Jannaschia sp. M317]|uniref:hypothetical protein n=1 Tax=Jannaschia sp. M317 TaxID=2867011 RepID=UPI0021A6881B|nr:hypothetical protein [Jannaschia sp. M317]UWQ17391.1 hypothetical protein K3551_16130 [Jannaschia sp. M317]
MDSLRLGLVTCAVICAASASPVVVATAKARARRAALRLTAGPAPSGVGPIRDRVMSATRKATS